MEIRAMKQEDGDAVTKAFEAHLSPTGVKERMETVREIDERDRVWGWVVVIDSTVAGCIMLEDVDDIDDALARPVPLSYDGHIGLVKNGYLRPQFIGDGFGSALLEALIKHATDAGLDVLIAEAWIRKGHRDAVDMLERYGFSNQFTDDPYWPQTDHCPDCGALEDPSDCACEGAVYVKRIDQS